MNEQTWYKIRPWLYGAASIYMGYEVVQAVLQNAVGAITVFQGALVVWLMYWAITDLKTLRLNKPRRDKR